MCMSQSPDGAWQRQDAPRRDKIITQGGRDGTTPDQRERGNRRICGGEKRDREKKGEREG